ncbi:MAG: N-acetyltransferase family protein [Dehalococcoidia bacterium]|nr:N-acetyltransferase family protein [Dehalococcoidia bacterium]
MHIEIRDATGDDLEAINAIYNDEILNGTATFDEEPWTAEERAAWFAKLGGPTTPVLVAEVDGVVAGFAYLSWYRPKAAYRYTREDTIYLDRRYRGRGLGGPLLTALLQRARCAEITLLVAVITSENEASIRLHERLGFRESGRLERCGYKFGQWLDVLEMTYYP